MVIMVDDISMNKFKNKLRFRKRPVRPITQTFDEIFENNDVTSETNSITEEVKSAVVEPIIPPKVYRFDNIVKSQQDAKNYRGLVLKENGMRVMLVSDPTAEKSAVCMTVEVGHMQDPPDIPGLAHLLEHVLFLGSVKYPSDSEFRSFISDHGGKTNAQTFADKTSYFFDIMPDRLPEALDRFSQMFIAPLLNEYSIIREISAVNSEHEKNFASDSWRIRMVNKTLASPCHPYSHFSTGSTHTLLDHPRKLGLNIRQELVRFHRNWYKSGNLMTLSIFGNKPLDELEELVREFFINDIGNNHCDVPYYDDKVFTMDQMMTKTFIEPTVDIRTLTLIFQTPDLREFYKSRPEDYLVSLIGHEGPGSILAELKRLGWSSSLNCDHVNYARGFGFFEIKVDFTDDGFKNLDEIVKMIFQYLNLIRDLGVKKTVFEELRELRDIEFRFEDEEGPISLVKKLSSAMRYYPMEDVLTASSGVMTGEFRPDLIHYILEMLNPKNARVVIVDQSSFYKCVFTEKIYKTKYGWEKIPQPTIRDWQICGSNSNLHIPRPNIFIPSDFEYLPIDDYKQTYPKIIRDNSLCRVWWLQDTEFRKPKSVMTVELKNPTVHVDPLNWNLTHIFVWLLEDYLAQQLYEAGLAGMECKISVTTSGIRIYIEGFSDKQNIFLETILNSIFRYKIDPIRFSDVYDSYYVDLKSFKSDKPQQVAIYYLSNILTEQTYSSEELIKHMRPVTIKRLESFTREILQTTHAESFMFGNVNEAKALELSRIIEKRLDKARSDSKTFIFVMIPTVANEKKLPEGIHHVYQVRSSHYKTNVTSQYIQCGIQDDKSNVILDLIHQIIREKFFYVLRTQEQQGYLVDCLVRRSNNTHGIKFVVESTKHPEYIDQRITSFLTTMTNEFSQISSEAFEAAKKALRAKKPLPSTLGEQFWKYYKEIAIQQYHFNRANVEASILRSLTLDEVVRFFKDFIAPENPCRRCISIHVIRDDDSTKNKKTSTSLMSQKNVVKIENMNYLIEDIDDFKRSLENFPTMQIKSLKKFRCKKR